MADTIDTAGQAPADTVTPETPASEAPKQEAPKGPSLAETIRVAREEREGRARAEAAHTDVKSQLQKAQDALEAERQAARDPIAWARARKMSKEQQAEFGQALLYDLVPDKAPPDFRVKLLESKIARDAKEREEAEGKRQEAVRTEQAARQLNNYQAAVKQAASSFASGSHPESEAWFGTDKEAWSLSLLNTAKNLASAGNAAGQQVDLSPATVARVLEADIAARQARRDKARGAASNTGKEGDKTPDGTEQRSENGTPTSTKGLSTGGPRGAALTDKERIERAIAAAFKAR